MTSTPPGSVDADAPVVVHGCDTTARLFWKRVTELGERTALREKDFGIWNEVSWREYGEFARACGLGLLALGLKRGDVVSIAAEICREWLYVDMGCGGVGVISNGVYPTDAPNQVEYLVNDSGTRLYFAEDEEQLDKILAVREQTPTLEKIVIFDMEGLRHLDDPMCLSFEAFVELGRQFERAHPQAWTTELAAGRPDDLLTLTYTSGTTGRPKGAMISHRNMLYQVNTLQWLYGVESADEQLGFLPLAHIAGRMFYAYLSIEAASVVNLVEDPETVTQDLQEVQPTVHFAVPRVWEKQFSTISIKLKDATAAGRFAYRHALRIGERAAKYRQAGEALPFGLRLANALADVLVFRNIRVLLGINNARWLSTAAAPIAPDLIDWFWAIGRPMYEVYGQTECTGMITGNREGAVRVGSIGRAALGSEVKITEAGEILLRGPGVIRGYWNKPDKTAETIRDGWLYSGDVGEMDEDGYLYIRDRMKDIIITAGGKNITPSEIENQMKFSPFISDAVVIGDKRKFLSCLVMIDQENVTKFAQDNNVPFTNYTSLCHAQAVQDMIWQEIEKVNARFARVETIKKFRLIDQLLDAEDEELTPTMKLKRKVVNEKYAALIDSMYQ